MGSAQSTGAGSNPSSTTGHLSSTQFSKDMNVDGHNANVDSKSNNDTDTIESMNDNSSSTATMTTSMEYYDPKRPKGGMPLVHYVCRKKKKSYDKCVSQWYSTDFLTGSGSSLNQEDVCGHKFELYRTCVLKGIKKEVWDKQNLPPPKKGSALAEVMETDDNEDDKDMQ
jgi:Uncharacterised protein family (UPF0203)